MSQSRFNILLMTSLTSSVILWLSWSLLLPQSQVFQVLSRIRGLDLLIPNLARSQGEGSGMLRPPGITNNARSGYKIRDKEKHWIENNPKKPELGRKFRPFPWEAPGERDWSCGQEQLCGMREGSPELMGSRWKLPGMGPGMWLQAGDGVRMLLTSSPASTGKTGLRNNDPGLDGSVPRRGWNDLGMASS